MKGREAKWLIALFLVFLTMAIGVWAGLIAWAEREGLLAVHTAVSEAAPWLLLWRVMLFSALMIFWREIMVALSRSFELSAAAQAALVSWRWRAGAGLVFMDLVLAEDLLGLLQRTAI